MPRKFSTTADVARRLGVRAWTVARLFERGLVEEPERLGRVRMIAEDRMQEVRDALERAKYLREDTDRA
jgi:hypothetical protein